MNSDVDKLYMQFVDFVDTYNLVVKTFLIWFPPCRVVPAQGLCWRSKLGPVMPFRVGPTQASPALQAPTGGLEPVVVSGPSHTVVEEDGGAACHATRDSVA
jgi:hypothetical protein